MSGLLLGVIVAALIAAVGAGAFVSIALLLGSPRPERDVTRRRAF
jgi:hypothetical protein